MDCYKRRRRYPKSNVGLKCVSVTKKKSSSSRVTKKKRNSSSRKHHRMKSSFIPSNLYSNDFYPANYFFQNDKFHPKFDFNLTSNSRGGVYNSSNNNRNYNSMINLNTPHLNQFQLHRHQMHHQQRSYLPSSRMLMSRPCYEYNNRKVSWSRRDGDKMCNWLNQIKDRVEEISWYYKTRNQKDWSAQNCWTVFKFFFAQRPIYLLRTLGESFQVMQFKISRAQRDSWMSKISIESSSAFDKSSDDTLNVSQGSIKIQLNVFELIELKSHDTIEWNENDSSHSFSTTESGEINNINFP